jgi:hypothetical protein
MKKNEFILTVLVLAVFIFAVSIFLFIKNEKYGMKPAVASSVVFIILLCIVIPLGNQPLTGDYKKEASVFTYD